MLEDRSAPPPRKWRRLGTAAHRVALLGPRQATTGDASTAPPSGSDPGSSASPSRTTGRSGSGSPTSTARASSAEKDAVALSGSMVIAVPGTTSSSRTSSSGARKIHATGARTDTAAGVTGTSAFQLPGRHLEVKFWGAVPVFTVVFLFCLATLWGFLRAYSARKDFRRRVADQNAGLMASAGLLTAIAAPAVTRKEPPPPLNLGSILAARPYSPKISIDIPAAKMSMDMEAHHRMRFSVAGDVPKRPFERRPRGSIVIAQGDLDAMQTQGLLPRPGHVRTRTNSSRLSQFFPAPAAVSNRISQFIPAFNLPRPRRETGATAHHGPSRLREDVFGFESTGEISRTSTVRTVVGYDEEKKGPESPVEVIKGLRSPPLSGGGRMRSVQAAGSRPGTPEWTPGDEAGLTEGAHAGLSQRTLTPQESLLPPYSSPPARHGAAMPSQGSASPSHSSESPGPSRLPSVRIDPAITEPRGPATAAAPLRVQTANLQRRPTLEVPGGVGRRSPSPVMPGSQKPGLRRQPTTVRSPIGGTMSSGGTRNSSFHPTPP